MTEIHKIAAKVGVSTTALLEAVLCCLDECASGNAHSTGDSA